MALDLDRRRPRLTERIPLARVGANAVAWPGTEPKVLDLGTVLVLQHLDGTAELGELVEDAADALEVEPDRLLGLVVAELESLAPSVVGLDPPEEATLDQSAEVLEERIDGAESVKVERLADGRTRRTTTVVVSSNNSSDQLTEVLASSALSDVLTTDSCMGAKLRVGESAVDLVVAVGANRTRLRVDHAETLVALRELLGEAMLDEAVCVTAADLPETDRFGRDTLGVSAYVTSPLEGVGPVRVYDRWGNRIGRPTGPGSAAALVGTLLAEEQPASQGAGVLVHAFAVTGPVGCVLLDDAVRGLPSVHRRLRALGLEPRDGRRVSVLADGTVELTSPWPTVQPERVELRGVLAIGSEPHIEPRSLALASMLHDMTASSPAAAQFALEHLAEVLVRLPAERLDVADLEQIPAAVAAILSNVGAN